MSSARCFRNTFEQPSSISIDDVDKRGLEQAILEGIDVRYLLLLFSSTVLARRPLIEELQRDLCARAAC